MKKNNGFTLIEMAVVLLIISLVLGGVMMGLTAQIDAKRVSDTQKGLADIKDALIGYAIANKHLPCPDKTGGGGAGTANDGQEDFVVGTGVCVNPEGNIPWVTLGIADVDGWSHRLHYRVDPVYSNRAPAALFRISSPAAVMSVCQTAPGGVCTTPLAVGVPAVILSFGPNGKGAMTTSGALVPAAAGPAATPPATNSDEYQNSNLDNIFVSRSRSAAGGALGEFDDLVDWLPTAVLVSRMTAAGVPPAP